MKPSISIAELVARNFGLSYAQLSALIYPTSDRAYRSFTITKKSGGERVIDAPRKKLKLIQKKIVSELDAIYTPKSCTHGFVEGRSIKTNAYRHVGKSFVFNVDLNNFFGSIHFGRVRNLLLSKPFGFDEVKATIYAQICCHNGVLPQGAPTSPLISNMICRKLDAQLQSLAAASRATYSRYVDDITFSFTCSKVRLPEEIVCFEEGIAVVGLGLLDIIKSNGFSINQQKVRLLDRGGRQEVTGITVNKFPNLPRNFIRKTRSIIYAIRKFGAVQAQQEYFDRYLSQDPLCQKIDVGRNDGSLILNIAKGRLDFISMVRGVSDSLYRKMAYSYSEAIGKPNRDLLKTPQELLSESVFRLENEQAAEQGTGFYLEGFGVVTNSHVVTGIERWFESNLNIFSAEAERHDDCFYVASDENTDLAVYYPSASVRKTKALKLGDDKFLNLGDEVYVTGYPDHADGDGVYFNKATIVQTHRRNGQNYFIVDAPILHGNSGGPILNSKMEVVGVATIGPKQYDGDVYHFGFQRISNLMKLKASCSYQSDFEHARLRSLNIKHLASGCFVVSDRYYCSKCFKDTATVSEWVETRDRGFFNCKFCAKIYKV